MGWASDRSEGGPVLFATVIGIWDLLAQRQARQRHR